MITISSGTASLLKLTKVKSKIYPKTAYVMLGSNCNNNCKFCSQASTSNSKSELLSRVDWHTFNDKDVFERINSAYLEGKLSRLCFQVVNNKTSFEDTLSILEKINGFCNIPVCASATVKTLTDAKKLFDSGLDRLCIALDAASSNIYNQIKGSDFHDKLNFLVELSKNFPGKITTHLIVGLGETEMDMANIIAFLSDNKITTALFAFTPIKGTPMENNQKPSMQTYRKIQIVNYLLQNGFITLQNISHTNDKITGFTTNIDIIYASNGKPFMTSGCPDCNRPYYNESPTSTPYNYPYQPSKYEFEEAIKSSGLLSS